MSITATRERLAYLLDTLPPLLKVIPAEEFSAPPAPGKWSKQQILGHLVDSAANNHQRFVRVQFEDTPAILYDQNQWNICNYYTKLQQEHLTELWTVYNRHLLHIMTYIPEDKLQRTCRTNEPAPVTLEWLMNDYVVHMEHHLRQLASY